MEFPPRRLARALALTAAVVVLSGGGSFVALADSPDAEANGPTSSGIAAGSEADDNAASVKEADGVTPEQTSATASTAADPTSAGVTETTTPPAPTVTGTEMPAAATEATRTDEPSSSPAPTSDPSQQETTTPPSPTAMTTRPAAPDPLSTRALTPADVFGPPDPKVPPSVATSTGQLAYTANGVEYTNSSTADEVLIYSTGDGTSIETKTITVAPGQSVKVPACDRAANSCHYVIGRFDSSGQPSYSGLSPMLNIEKLPDTVYTGPVVLSVGSSGQGYPADFVVNGDQVLFTNPTTKPLVVSGYLDGDETLQPGESILLPNCAVALSVQCGYTIGYVPLGNELPYSFTISSQNGKVSYQSLGAYGAAFVPGDSGYTFTNMQAFPVYVEYLYRGESGARMLVAPGSSAQFPRCAVSTCVFAVYGTGPTGEPDDLYHHFLQVSNIPALDGSSPTVPETSPSSPPRSRPSLGIPKRLNSSTNSVSSSSREGTTPRYPASYRTPTGSAISPASGPYVGQAPTLDLCAQLGYFGAATEAGALANLSYACSGIQFGHAVGTGDWSAALNTSAGWAASALKATKNPVAYLGGVAIEAVAYAASEAAHTDFSSQTLASTGAYAAQNPGVVVQETFKAVLVVASNLWGIFL